MENIIAPVRINDPSSILWDLFENTIDDEPTSFIECGAKSWVIDSNPYFEKAWSSILRRHYLVHPSLCPLATGFNFSANNQQTVPPHIDVDEGRYFNLLIPIKGVAKINIYETKEEDLGFRHGKTHWKMLKPGVEVKKIGSYSLDRPTLLDTKVLHSVSPIITPRVVWCTRWVGLPEGTTFQEFKEKVEAYLRA